MRAISLLALSLLAGCVVDEPTDETTTASLTIPTQPTTLVRQGSNKCLHTSGSAVQQSSCNGTAAQSFTFESRGNGAYRLRNAASGKCLDVAGGGTSNGTKIQLWSCGSTGNQKFTVQDLGGGFVRLRHPGSGKCIDVNGASNADGAKVQLWSCNGTAAQAWTLGAAAPPTEWRQANLTWFTSYPDPGSEECEEFNGCMWAGYFAFVDGQQSEQWVMDHDIAAVHSRDASQYALKTLRLRQGSHQLDVTVYDMCSDSDCDGCCTENASETGFLIDLESYTAERFGSGDGIVEWRCLDC